MKLAQLLFRMGSYVRYLFRSGNTMGYGIHSPHLFNIARVIVPETAKYYCYSRIEQERNTLLRRRDEVEVVDFGTGGQGKGGNGVGKRIVGDMARKSLKSRAEAQLLFRLVNFEQAEMIVELGTCLGLTTAYLAAPRPESEVWTFEGSEALLEIARGVWKRLGMSNIRAVSGNIDETLAATAEKWEKTVDFAFIDANHSYEATVRYFDLLAAHAGEKSVFVVDDIRWSKEMWQAWETIGERDAVTARMDLGTMGLVFFDNYLPKQVFTLRM